MDELHRYPSVIGSFLCVLAPTLWYCRVATAHSHLRHSPFQIEEIEIDVFFMSANVVTASKITKDH